MTTRNFAHIADAGKNAYIRLFNEIGQAFDFADNSFKALSGATTPYKAMTERTDMDGTSRSGYTVSLDLSLLNDTLAVQSFVVQVYDNATPDDADVAISDPAGLEVQLGDWGRRELIVMVEVSVKTTEGTEAQLACWLESDGTKVNVHSIGGVTFTADAGTDFCTSTAHGLSNADVLTLTTDNTLPAGLASDTAYYVVNKTANTFQLSLTSGGAAINITTTGAGVHNWRQPTAAVSLREQSSGIVSFTAAMTAADIDAVSSVMQSIFESEKSSPGFTDDRQYEVTGTITVDGVAISTTHRKVVIG